MSYLNENDYLRDIIFQWQTKNAGWIEAYPVTRRKSRIPGTVSWCIVIGLEKVMYHIYFYIQPPRGFGTNFIIYGGNDYPIVKALEVTDSALIEQFVMIVEHETGEPLYI